MRSFRRRQRRNQTALNDIPLTPLIDTALTLLIIFMVASPMINNAIKVSLPKSNMQEASNTPQEFVVYVDHTNTIFFDGKSMSDADLVIALNQALAGKEDQVVFIKGDEAAIYGKIYKLVDHIQEKVDGIRHVELVSEKRL